MSVLVSTSGSRFKIYEYDGEVGEDGEGDLLLEWYLDLDSLAIHSSWPSF